ncbi:MAG: hypothetical protein R6V46_02365 [Desulfatiglandaceae bacterium]
MEAIHNVASSTYTRTSKRDQLSCPAGRRHWLTRLIVTAIGLLFLVAAVSKAVDMGLFVRQIKAYGIIYDPGVITVIAWALVALEWSLGICLIIFYRPRLALSATATLLFVFLGVTISASLTGSIENCGCFGSWIARSPAHEAVQNIVLICVTLLAWKIYSPVSTKRSNSKSWVVIAAGVVGLALPTISGSYFLNPSPPPAQRTELSMRNLEVQGLDGIDLNTGIYLVFLMSTDCLHCQEVLPEVEFLSESGNAPQTVVLCADNDDQITRFKADFQPLIPIGRIDKDSFWNLLGNAELPRLFLVKDAKVVQVWDGTVPAETDIQAAESSSQTA